MWMLFRRNKNASAILQDNWQVKWPEGDVIWPTLEQTLAVQCLVMCTSLTCRLCSGYCGQRWWRNCWQNWKKKRMINFFSLKKTIGHCLKVTREKKLCRSWLFIAKQLQYVEIYLKCQVNRNPFMPLPCPWDLVHDFENYFVKRYNSIPEFYTGRRRNPSSEYNV